MPQPEPTSGRPRSRGAAPLKAAAFLSLAILLSKLLGFVQLRMINGNLNADATDAYYAAFRLPEFINYLVAGGALSATFIPLFIEAKTAEGDKAAWKFFSSIVTIMGVALAVLLFVGWLFSSPITWLTNPGFHDTPAKVALTASMTKVLLPAQIFFYVGGMIVGVLNAHKRFGATGLTSAVYNVVAIVVGFTLWILTGTIGFAWGILIGALCGNFLLPLWAALQGPADERIRYTPSFDWRNPALQRFFRNALPIMLGVSFPVIDQLVVGFFGSYLPQDGDYTCLATANRVMVAPLSILAQAASVAAFPYMAGDSAREDWAGLTTFLRSGLRRLVFLSLPISTLFILCAHPIIDFMFRTGKFSTDDDIDKASIAFAFYCVGLFAWAGQQFVARGFYALQDTRTPTIIGSLITVFFFIPICWLTRHSIAGLAFATSIGACAHFCGVLIYFEQKLARAPYNVQLHSTRVLGTLLRTATACLIMGIAGLVVRHFTHNWRPLLEIFALCLVTIPAFVIASKKFDIPEYNWLENKITARLRGRAARPAAVDLDETD